MGGVPVPVAFITKLCFRIAAVSRSGIILLFGSVKVTYIFEEIPVSVLEQHFVLDSELVFVYSLH